jgi:phage/plasmid-like protein (TIGR03299 family)
MSYHTSQYLNSGNILVGNVKNSRNAWWYNQDLENPALPTHFQDFIPLDTVKDRLFGWSAWESNRLVAYFDRPEMDSEGNSVLDSNGNVVMKTYEIPVSSFKAIGREDWVVNGVPDGEEAGADAILYVQGIGYGIHQLKETFITSTAQILQGADNMVGVSSAGLLKWGRVAWITVTIPENIRNDASGLEFRPNLTVSTSFDSSLATSWTRTFGVPVCDNTLDYQLAKSGQSGKYTLKHTKNSAMKISDAAQILGLLNEQGEDMDRVLSEFSNTEVPEKVFLQWLDKVVPVPEVKTSIVEVLSIQGEKVQTEKVSTNGQTQALNKRDKLVEMWDNDPRVSPWKNTKLGILQLWNTFNQHERTTKTGKAFAGNAVAAKVEGNQLKTLSGDFYSDKKSGDGIALKFLDEVLADQIVIPVTTPQGKRTRAAAAGAAK